MSAASPATASLRAGAVLVMARAPRRGEVRRGLESLLGPARCVGLEAELLARAIEWGEAIAPGRVHLAYEPADAAAELRRFGERLTLLPQRGEGLAARVSDAAGRVFAGCDGPLLVVWPDLPRLREEHARAALEDLANGCRLVLGPEFERGMYLIGMPELRAELFSVPEAAWRSGEVIGAAVAGAAEAGIEVGLLRAERGLRRPADVRAALADPLLPPRLRQLLRGSDERPPEARAGN